MLKNWFLILFAILLSTQVQATWPLRLEVPKQTFSYPKIVPDNQGGCYVGGVSWGSWLGNVWVFRLTADGDSLWSRRVAATPNDEMLLDVQADGDGWCYVLIRESYSYIPPDSDAVKLVCLDSAGVFQWQYYLRDSIPGTVAGTTRLGPIGHSVVATWDVGIVDSTAQSLAMLGRTGEVIIPPMRIGRAMGVRFVAIRDTLFCVTSFQIWKIVPDLGFVDTLANPYGCLGVTLGPEGRLYFLCGNQLAGLLALRYLQNDSIFLADSFNVGAVYTELGLCRYGNGVFFSYPRSSNLFCRTYEPASGMSAEMTVCDAPQTQYFHETYSADSAVVMLWCDRRADPAVYVQQFRNGEFRWPNGLFVFSPISISPMPTLSGCGVGAHGLVAWSDAGWIYVQPMDSLPPNSIPPATFSQPATFRLYSPYPNPTNANVTIAYNLDVPLSLRLIVYNALGQQVAVLREGRQEPGEYHLSWSNSLPSGYYWIRLETENALQTKPLLVIR